MLISNAMPAVFSRFLFILLVALAGWFGVSRLDFDVDPLSLLPQDLPGLEGTRLLRDLKSDQLIGKHIRRLFLCIQDGNTFFSTAGEIEELSGSYVFQIPPRWFNIGKTRCSPQPFYFICFFHQEPLPCQFIC